MVFIPTYLYIKQHTITGKLYFGKTTRPLKRMLSYKGSGVHWTRHIKYHGAEHVVTLWYQLYLDPFNLVTDALFFSHKMEIVKSDSWLNLTVEHGLDGNGHPGELNGRYGATVSEAQKARQRATLAKRTKEQNKASYSRVKTSEELSKIAKARAIFVCRIRDRKVMDIGNFMKYP